MLPVADLQPERLEQPATRSAARSGPPAGLSSPLTSHTSPSQVQTAARLPSGKKSKPVSRSWAFHGFFSGRANVSTANGPSFLPIVAAVFRISGQRFGPPSVSGFSARGRRGLGERVQSVCFTFRHQHLHTYRSFRAREC